MKPHTIIPLAAAALLASSCTNSSHLLVYQHSNIGLNTGVNPANQSVHVRVGVRNEVVAIVPKYVIPPPDTTEKNPGVEPQKKFEAASAYFGSRFRVNSIWEVPEAAEVLATGNAAVLAASKGRLTLKSRHDDVPTAQATNTSVPVDPIPPSASDSGDLVTQIP